MGSIGGFAVSTAGDNGIYSIVSANKKIVTGTLAYPPGSVPGW